jgi:hypothetical protein
MNAPSAMCSKYWTWFAEEGYPELDIIEYPDGEWAIIQYYSQPIIPSLTRWNFVLTGLRNIIPTKSMVIKFAKNLDLTRKEKHAAEEEKTKAVELEAEARERHAVDLGERCSEAVLKNPELMERIARNGLKEMDLLKIRSNIPNYRFGGNFL